VLNILGFWGVIMVILQVVSNICEGLYFPHYGEQAVNYTTVLQNISNYSPMNSI
jgi:hypothetical protein